MKRREFIKRIGFGILGQAALASAPGLLLPEDLFAKTSNKLFIKVFLRGGMDGLSFLVPKSNTQYNLYAKDRPNLKIPKSQLLGLKDNANWGLHPEATKFRSLFNNNQGILFHGAGSTNNTRSHFTQMDIIEGGNNALIKSSGYIFDALGNGAGKLDMVSMGTKVAASMRGVGSKAMSMSRPESFSKVVGVFKDYRIETNKADRLKGMAVDKNGGCGEFASGYMRRMYCDTAVQTTSALNDVESNLSSIKNSQIDSNYGGSKFGSDFKEAIRLASSNVNVKTINIDMGGWDTHNDEGVLNGQFNNQIKTLNQVISAATDDLKSIGMWNNTVILIMSEFGRTIAQNGTLPITVVEEP